MAGKALDIAKGGATAFVAGLGVPREVVDLCHEHGLVVVNMCGEVRHAVAAVEAGCDLVVARGTEAGGHTGEVPTFALVPRWSTPWATACRWSPPAASSTGGAWPPPWPSGRTGRGSAPASSPPPRRGVVVGYKDKLRG